MYVCMYVCMYKYNICMYIYICINIIYIYICIYINNCIYVYMYKYIHTCVYIYMYVSHMYVYIIWIYIYIYIRLHTCQYEYFWHMYIFDHICIYLCSPDVGSSALGPTSLSSASPQWRWHCRTLLIYRKMYRVQWKFAFHLYKCEYRKNKKHINKNNICHIVR